MALETTATFIGHNECYGLSEDKLKEAIRGLIENGVTDFLSGGQGGFDRLCGHCVYELKKSIRISTIILLFLICLSMSTTKSFSTRLYIPMGLRNIISNQLSPHGTGIWWIIQTMPFVSLHILGALQPRPSKEPRGKSSE